MATLQFIRLHLHTMYLSSSYYHFKLAIWRYVCLRFHNHVFCNINVAYYKANFWRWWVDQTVEDILTSRSTGSRRFGIVDQMGVDVLGVDVMALIHAYDQVDADADKWVLNSCFGFNDHFRHYFSLYRAVCRREVERTETIEERKIV